MAFFALVSFYLPIVTAIQALLQVLTGRLVSSAALVMCVSHDTVA